MTRPSGNLLHRDRSDIQSPRPILW